MLPELAARRHPLGQRRHLGTVDAARAAARHRAVPDHPRYRFVQVRALPRGRCATLVPRDAGRRGRRAEPLPGLHDRAGRLHRHRQHRRAWPPPWSPAGRARVFWIWCYGFFATAIKFTRGRAGHHVPRRWTASGCPPGPCTTCATACSSPRLGWVYALVRRHRRPHHHARSRSPTRSPSCWQSQFGHPHLGHRAS